MKIKTLVAFVLGLAIAGGLSVRAAGTILNPIGGGTGQNALTSSQLLYGAGQNPVQTVATSTRTFSSSFTTTGTLGYLVGGTNSTIDLSNTGVTAGTYGTSTSTPQLTVDAQGRLSLVTNVPIAIAGSKAYYAYATQATSSPAYYNMNPTATTTSSTVAYPLSTSPQTVQNWISPVGDPGITVIPGGSYIVDLFAWRSSGSASITLAVQVWEVSSTGADISQIGTTNSTPNLTNAKAQYQVSFTTSEHTMASSASRILMRVVATTAGTPTLSLAMGSSDQMDLTTPGATVDVTNFVPYTGATANVNLGTFSASTTQLTVSSNTYLPLTGLLKGNGAGSAVTTGSNGTDYTLITANTCTNQVFTAATAAGVFSCSSVSNAMLSNSTIALTDSNSTLTIGGSPASLGGTLTATFNLAHSNAWTALQTFANASSTQFSAGVGGGLYVNSVGMVGISSTTPNFALSVGTAGKGLYVATTSGETVGYDATNAWPGRISPTHSFVLSTATTTTWTGTTTGAYIPQLAMPFAGTLQQVRCVATSTAAFLNVAPYIGTAQTTPGSFVASTTVGIEKFTANNTFSAGNLISMYVGTSTASTANLGVSCTFDVTETP